VDAQFVQLPTDAGLVRQILINLLTNALDATVAAQTAAYGTNPPPAPGRVTVSAQLVSEGKQVELSVRDEGSGIAPDDIARIFEPFYTTKGRGRGTGLGLSICRELARTLGGKITVASMPGEGSTFAVVLPTHPPSS
jgi:two-component system cell cycle sensor histidine kinase/response regulator CckA